MAPITRRTLADQVYAELKDLLMTGQAAPGERLTLRGLAAVIGTSPMPIREAVRRLVAERALEMLPNRTLRVSKPGRARFAEITSIRCALEGLAAETAAVERTPSELAEIEHHYRVFVDASHRKRPDVALVIRANKSFHFAIYRAAHMPVLVEIIEGLWLQIGPVFNSDLKGTMRRLTEIDAHAHHARLLAGLRNADRHEAREGLIADIQSSARFILRHGGIFE